MDKKYQIFISSTYEDLKQQRESVIKAILEMGNFPVGMELFSAADEEQWKLIKRQIDQSDYYLVIVAHRYGSMEKNKSFTEKEYDYANQVKVPTLGFVINDDASWPTDRVDSGENKKRLDKFKKKIKKKYISYWTNSEDLYGKVSIALMKQFSLNPSRGWVRTPEILGADTTVELTRLSKENSDLRGRITKLQQLNKEEETEEEQKIIHLLKKK